MDTQAEDASRLVIAFKRASSYIIGFSFAIHHKVGRKSAPSYKLSVNSNTNEISISHICDIRKFKNGNESCICYESRVTF